MVSMLVLLFLGSCGHGFEAAKPDPDQIMAIRNQTFSATPLARIAPDTPPIPMPMRKGTQPLLPKPTPPSESVLVEPLRLRSSANPAAIGLVEDADVHVAPFNTAAKLTFAVGSSGYSCTAEVVGDTGDVLMTAGHCVYDSKKSTWGRNFSVYLGYNNGSSTAIYDWQCAAIFSGWAQGEWRSDFAFIKLRGKAPAALGIRLGFNDSQWTSIGYPAKYGNAQKLKKVEGTRGILEDSDIQMLHNPMGHGASGGAWIVGNYAVGLNSYIHDENDPNMYGPIFDSRTSRLYQYVRNGCKDDIVPLGRNRRIETYDSTKAYIEADSAAVGVGPTVSIDANSRACPCQGAASIVLENSSTKSYAVDLDYLASSGDVPIVQGANRVGTIIEPKSKILLGCTFGDANGNACSIGMQFALKQARQHLTTMKGKALATPITVSQDFCAEQCINNPDGGYCLGLGGPAKPILTPLAQFTGTLLNSSSTGVIATKRDLITKFGGDPNRQQDPCSRSDFYQAGQTITNDGIGCRTTSPMISGKPDESRLSMRTPPAAAAVRANSALWPTMARANFEARDEAPVIEFYGAAGNDLNSEYGGHVIGVQRLGGKLIVTTEHGCLQGNE